MSGRRRRWVAAGLGVLGAGLVCAGSVRSLFFFPGAQTGVPVNCAADAPTAPADSALSVLVWNIQFAAGRDQAFFYDYGDAVSVPREDVEQTLEAIAGVIADHDPDVVLLQEVDRNSRRTHRIDEHAWLAEHTGYPCHASTPYFRAAYVPHPPHEHLGKVDMHLSVFSRYRIDDAVRYQLPLLQESSVRRLFNLKRAVLEVRMPVGPGGQLVLFNTHLSAFSRGDGTLGRQIDLLRAHADAAEAAGTPWVLAGDFNSLPPGDDPSRFDPSEQVLYAEDVTPIQPLFDHYGDPVGAGWADDPTAYRTFVKFGDDAPDRTIDYVFHGKRVNPVSYEVLQQYVALSDHLPLLFSFEPL